MCWSCRPAATDLVALGVGAVAERRVVPSSAATCWHAPAAAVTHRRCAPCLV